MQNGEVPKWSQSCEGKMLEVIARKCYSVWMDLKYGGILRGSVPSRHPEGFETANSGYDVLEHLLSERVRPNDVFVDVGCGKGRALNWWIEHYHQAKGYGLEIDKDVGQKVKLRLRRYSQISILIGDAPQLIPEDGSLFYLFNPFGENVMQRFADQIALNPVCSNGIPRRIVYYFSRFLRPFERPEFKIAQLKLPDHDCAIIDAAV